MTSRVAMAASVLLFSGAARADFGYQSRMEIIGGALLKSAGDAGFRARRPVAEHLIKGKRMAIVSGKHTTVINLENDTILEIDFAGKTYSSTPFTAIKEKLDRWLKGAAFASTARSGGAKRIGLLTAREHIVTMRRAAEGPPALARIFLDYWTMTPPGFREMQDFHEQLAAKLGYAYAWGLTGIGMIQPELLPGFEAAAKVLTESQEMPVICTIRLGAAGTGDLAPPAETAEARAGIVSETLSRIGNLTHLKSKKPPADEDPALLGEVMLELGEFGNGPADQSKFNVPAGFKEVKAAAPKP
ncbi:MAG TPA: hypothetical protein VMB85_14920 [Bryobacteraceae bacterium]|nr:hypothetical protein [Bryobacteraceae bacterium]